MSLAGKLEDVPLADVMQFIHLGRRTGTLTLQRGEERAEVNFHRGAIVGAHSPRSLRLGELLVDEGVLSQDQLTEALQVQEESKPHRSLGQVLFTRGLVSVDDVRQTIRGQIERTIYELVTWTHGSFVFELDTLKPVDDIAIFPGDLIPDIDINTQMVLLEAARIFDERNRGGDDTADTRPQARVRPESGERPSLRQGPSREEPADETQPAIGASAPATRSERPRVENRAGKRPIVHLLVGGDAELAEELEARFGAEGVLAGRVDPEHAGEPAGPDESVILVFELRPGETSLAELAEITRRHPGLPVICVVDEIAAAGRAYEAGAAAVVPREAEAVFGCFQSMARFRGLSAHDPTTIASKAAFAKLRRVVADLRSGVFSASVALNLMNIIAESVERAVLFLVRRDGLSALGAFGFNDANRPLAEVTRGLVIPLDEDNAFTGALRTGRALSVPFDRAALPATFVERIGRPANRQIVIFPVLGSERVILLIYTDNGPLDRPIEEIDIIDLAASEVGMAFENELLRRQLSKKG